MAGSRVLADARDWRRQQIWMCVNGSPSYTFVSLVSSKPGRQKVRPAAALVLTPCESAADSYAPPGSESESPAMAQGSTCCQTPLATTLSPSQLETSVEPPPQTSLIIALCCVFCAPFSCPTLCVLIRLHCLVLYGSNTDSSTSLPFVRPTSLRKGLDLYAKQRSGESSLRHGGCFCQLRDPFPIGVPG